MAVHLWNTCSQWVKALSYTIITPSPNYDLKSYDVTGVYMQNWNSHDEQSYCSGEQDFLDALKVADTIGIPLKRISFEKDYWNLVFSQVTAGYENGITPNPDVLCNKHIKFGALFDYAMSHLSVEWLATGHYARLDYSKKGVRLLKAKDQNKDQTYFLGQVSQESLRKTLFPVGDLIKSEVKELARMARLEFIARKKESFGMCFIGKRNFKDFINEYVTSKPGVMINIDSNQPVCDHQGIHLWTVGQRIYLGGQEKSYYVCDINPESNIIYVAAGRDHPALESHELTCAAPHWISYKHKQKFEDLQVLVCEVRTRYRAELCRCNLYYDSAHNTGNILVDLADPMSCVAAAGQYAVFYDSDECIGSAQIINRDVCTLPSGEKRQSL